MDVTKTLLMMLWIAGVWVTQACVLERSGIDFDSAIAVDSVTADTSRDQAADSPKNDLAPHDVAAEQGDTAPDIFVAVECVDQANGLVCVADESRGVAGECAESIFSKGRHCFDFAPCLSGLCTPSGCNSCNSSNDCDGDSHCAPFVVNPGFTIKQCCVGASDNGNGDFETPCERGDECRSGVCAREAGGMRRCFEPCNDPSNCGAGSCASDLTIEVGGRDWSVSGCVPRQPDAGMDALADQAVDAGTGDSTSDQMHDQMVDQLIDGTDGPSSD